MLLCEIRIHMRERQHVEGQVPCRKPGVLPRVRHRQYVAAVEVFPSGVSTIHTRCGRLGHLRIAFEPILDDVVVELLAPQQAGVGLARNQARVRAQVVGKNLRVKRVGFPLAGCKRFRKFVVERAGGRSVPAAQTQANAAGFPGLQRHLVVRCGLGPDLLGIHGVLIAANNRSMEGVLNVWRAQGYPKQAAGVGFVFGKKHVRRIITVRGLKAQREFSQRRVIQRDAVGFGQHHPRFKRAALVPTPPRPGIAKPQRRQQVKHCLFRPTVRDRDPNQQIVRRRLGVLYCDIEIPILLKHAGVSQLKLRVIKSAAPVFFYQAFIRKRRLRVLV